MWFFNVHIVPLIAIVCLFRCVLVIEHLLPVRWLSPLRCGILLIIVLFLMFNREGPTAWLVLRLIFCLLWVKTLVFIRVVQIFLQLCHGWSEWLSSLNVLIDDTLRVIWRQDRVCYTLSVTRRLTEFFAGREVRDGLFARATELLYGALMLSLTVDVFLGLAEPSPFNDFLHIR